MAEANFIGVDRHGRRTPINLKIGLPYKVDGADAACPMSLQGMHQRLADVHGVDTFHALCLSIRRAKALLKSYIENGQELYYSTDGSDAPLRVDLEMIDQIFPS